jgi:hypothetical protein
VGSFDEEYMIDSAIQNRISKMTTDGSATFLQQAQRNSWQQYLAALQPGSAVGWDMCILTASDEVQARMYCRQLALARILSPGLAHILMQLTG